MNGFTFLKIFMTEVFLCYLFIRYLAFEINIRERRIYGPKKKPKEIKLRHDNYPFE